MTADPSAAQAACILVVDDDEAIREALMDVLADEGYAVACAENGKRALESIRKRRPSLVLLDLMMPVMSGWEVLDSLKCSSALADLPVVIVSAMTAPGARATLAKPVALEELLAVVRRLVGKPRGQA